LAQVCNVHRPMEIHQWKLWRCSIDRECLHPSQGWRSHENEVFKISNPPNFSEWFFNLLLLDGLSNSDILWLLDHGNEFFLEPFSLCNGNSAYVENIVIHMFQPFQNIGTCVSACMAGHEWIWLQFN
jgi:hypothetical protein